VLPSTLVAERFPRGEQRIDGSDQAETGSDELSEVREVGSRGPAGRTVPIAWFF
jgi:hypothetical protein